MNNGQCILPSSLFLIGGLQKCTMRVVLVDKSPVLCRHWSSQIQSFLRAKQPLEAIGREVTLEVQNKAIEQLQVFNGSTVVVTPGNSAGLMGGGIDLAIRDCFVGVDSSAEAVQKHVLEQLQAYKPPGAPTMVHFPIEMIMGSVAQMNWNCSELVHLPTMRVPERIQETPKHFHKHLFDWTWNVISMVNPSVDTLIIPGLGTGFGAAPLNICANAMIAAITIFFARDYTPAEKTVLAYKFLGDDYKKLDIPLFLDHNPTYQIDEPLEQLFSHTAAQ